MTKNERALVTGASSGIGLALAKEFARNGHPLVISSPIWEELAVVAKEIERAFQIDVIPIAKDLTDERAPYEIFDELEELGAEIHILVNNAGRGMSGYFSETAMKEDVEIIRLNIEAVVRMTKLFLPPMLERNSGAILNTASIAGFEPGPLMSVYHASKAFVLSFTEAIAVELENTDITVTALCPGATDTDFFPKARMTQTRIYQKGNLMSPQEVASTAYEALIRGDRICVPGAMNKALVAKRRFLTIPATAKLNEKFYERVPAQQSR